jgi:hypothetical protein
MTNDEYNLWLLDSSRDKHRILLIEIDHPAIPIYHPSISSEYPAGTIYLASRAHMDHLGQAYDDWLLLPLPDMETNLENFGGIGNFKAKNDDATIRWDDVAWHGQECRWLFGDDCWSRHWFKTIETSVVDQCVADGAGVYDFELMDGGLKLNKQLVSVTTTRNETAQSFINWVAGELGVAISFVNVPTAKLSLSVEVKLFTTSSAGTVLRDIARDMGAKLRRNLGGDVEIFVPENTITEILIDEIAADRIRVIEVVKPYSRVELTMHDDVVVGADTGVSMGSLERVRKLGTYLDVLSDVNALLAQLVLECAGPCSIYEVPVVIFGDTLTVGDKVHTNHPDLVRNGIVNRIIKTPLSIASTLEILA